MRYTFLFIMIIIVYSCEDKKKVSSYDYYLSENQEYEVEIDASISPVPAAVQYVPEENIVILNNRYANDRSLIVIDAKTFQFRHKIKFDSEGENSPQANPLNFYYHNKDSLFLVNIFSKKLYLLDSMGKTLYKTFDFNGFATFIDQWQLGMGNNEGNFSQGVFQIICEPNDMMNTEKSKNDPLLAYLNLEIGEMKISRLTYGLNNPFNIPIQHPWLQVPLTTTTQEGTLLTFGHSKSIYLINDDGVHKEIPLKSDFFDDFDKMKKFDNQELDKFYVESYCIDRLFHDKQNQLTYVFLYHAIPYVNKDTGKMNSYEDKPFSVIVLDSSFKKLTEQKFEGSKYSLMGSFTTSEGLFLSLNNPHSETFNENLFKYKQFKLTHK